MPHVQESKDDTGTSTPSLAEATKVAKAAFLGTAIEWYDFYIYASTAALVFGKQFFPAMSDVAATLASFATIAVAFAARPIGGLIFAHFGDRIGRKATLVVSLVLMGVSTMLVGVLPTYETAGAIAPVLLVLLRFVQGAAVGGEWGGAVLMATEFAPQDRRARLSSWPQQGVTAGLALSTAVLLLITLVIPDQTYLDWGWRVPFLSSAALIVVGLVLRLRISESPVFEASRRKAADAGPGKVSGPPIVSVVKQARRTTVLATLAYVSVSTTFYVAFIFLLAHATGELEMSKASALTAVLISAGAYSIGLRLSAGTADRRGRRTALLWGLGGAIVSIFPVLALVETGKPVLFTVALALFAFPVGFAYAPVGVYFAELFPTAIRYSGVTAANQAGSLLGAAVAPFIAVGLYEGIGMYAVGGYVVLVSLISAGAVWALGETRHLDLRR
ncbi:MFS transporter [Actinomadura mexicana]|uniref:Putative proline/betaine transporter n=1 Tax=Actinomadura mexicana TaxID=134959 RepID=A0A239AZN6_9ACTN|nr:MFS transporter [Actinomadura mexicana]SNS00484.1 Predicted arabinose efflux permease, MFS family [Actinomadura mexicana]